MLEYWVEIGLVVLENLRPREEECDDAGVASAQRDDGRVVGAASAHARANGTRERARNRTPLWTVAPNAREEKPIRECAREERVAAHAAPGCRVREKANPRREQQRWVGLTAGRGRERERERERERAEGTAR